MVLRIRGYGIDLHTYFNEVTASAPYDFYIVDNNKGEISAGEVTLEYDEKKEGKKGFLGTAWGLLTDTTNTVATMVEGIIVDILLPLGDGVVYIMSKCVGEGVTSSRIIYNQVDKISVDYWTHKDNANTVPGMMAKVVTPVYNLFYQVAVIVDMMCLLVISIKIMFTSTAEQKAKYKESLVSWVVGVAMLTLFPFVMKYVVVLNNTVVGTLQSYSISNTSGGSVELPAVKPKILSVSSTIDAIKMFGKSEFVLSMIYDSNDSRHNDSSISPLQINDSMMRIRLYAQYKKKVLLAIIYFILIGQTLIILFMYYKRAFMLAFLIVLFPLVAMTYVIDKMGDKKAQSFEIWFKEYVVNVIVNLFHALVYTIVISLSVEAYLKNDAYWLFMIIAVLFLFEGEKILRSIFGAESQANTIGDLAATGLAMKGAATSAVGMVGGNGGATGSNQDRRDASNAEDRQKKRENTPTPGAGGNSSQPPPSGGDSGGDSGGSGGGDSGGDSGGSDGGAQQPTGGDTSAARDTVIQNAYKRRLKKGFASRAINNVSKGAGMAIAATYGMSKGDTGGGIAANTLGAATVGGMVGKALSEPASKLANTIEKNASGKKLAKDISKGKMDGELGLDPSQGAPGLPPTLSPDEIIGKHGESVQEIYREALAAMAMAAAKKGQAAGEAAYWDYIDKNTMSKS